MTVESSILNRIIKITILLTIVVMMFLTSDFVLGAPSSTLNITIVSTYQLQLKWEDNLTNERGYKIEKKVDTGSFTELVSLYSNITTYNDTNVNSSHVYTYRVSVIDSGGSTSVYTNEVVIATNAISAPVSLTVTPVTSSQLDLKWAFVGSDTHDVVVERKINSNAWTVIANVEKDTTNYSDTGLQTNTMYYYRVRAVSGEYIQTRPYPDDDYGVGAYTKLNAPENVYGYAPSYSQIYLIWTGNSNDASYIIERKTGAAGSFEYMTTAGSSTAMWLDSGLTPNIHYTYRIKAAFGANSSDYSEEVVITCTPLQYPTDLTAVAISENEIKLAWSDNSNSESGYEIWRKVGKTGIWERFTSVARNVTSFDDTELLSDTLYFYRVRAHRVYSSVYSAFTNEDEAWTIAMSAPDDFRYTALSTTSIKLFWADNANNEDGYAVERKEGFDGSWTEIVSLPEDSTGYEDKHLSANKQYFYRLKVFDNTYYNNAAYSEELEVTTTVPGSPSRLTLVTVSSSQVRINWSDGSGNETGFKIERRLYPSTGYIEIGKVGPNETTFLDSGLKSKAKYYYRVTAYNKTGKSSYSNETYIVTKASIVYTDVPASYWANKEIMNLASRGIFRVKNGDKFYPEEKITRGEFIYLLVKAFNLSRVPVGAFKDVNSKHAYYKEIMSASKVGIITESTGSYFYPNRLISREEMAVFAARALKSVDKLLPDHDISIMEEFSDKDSISGSALQSLCSLYGERILSGKTVKGKRYIAPKDSTTRAEAAVVIYRIIDRP